MADSTPTDRQLARLNAFLATLSPECQQDLTQAVSRQVVKKGDFLLRQGEVCRYSFTLEAGIARKYYLRDGLEITTELNFAEDLLVAFGSYAHQTPSTEWIQALTDCTVQRLSHRDFQRLKTVHPPLLELDLLLTEYHAIQLEERLNHLQFRTARERYALLMTRQPHLIRHIPVTYLASYLGVTLETLSRIRAAR
jgi:CRP-like cAMP-binding protein